MRLATVIGLLSLGAGLAVAQGAAPAAAPATLSAGTRVQAELKTKLDSKHAHVGDTVKAVTTADVKQNGVKILPKGSTLTGHVTEVTAAESGKSPSHIGVLFDQAVTKQGQPVALHAGIRQVLIASAPPMDMGGPAMEPMPMPPAQPDSGGNPRMGGMDVGGVAGGAVAGVTSPVMRGSAAGGIDGAAGAGPLGAGGAVASAARASNGAPLSIRLPEVSAGEAAQAGSVISTPHGDVEINSGTRVELQVMQ
ncbi:MAG TPA: hypothetical protein VN515_08720 [Terriglobales bacterium]|nr:hypothetical protein [Terriglobales bacterium]